VCVHWSVALVVPRTRSLEVAVTGESDCCAVSQQAIGKIRKDSEGMRSEITEHLRAAQARTRAFELSLSEAKVPDYQACSGWPSFLKCTSAELANYCTTSLTLVHHH
jgi:hypothetical protein